MPKRRQEFASGNYYHIYNRGAARQPIFREAEDYEYVLGRVKKVATTSQITVVAYCLMPNHYHWLVRQDGQIGAGQLPQRVFNSYTKWFNRKYDLSGTLFEGRFKANLVDKDEYLRHLCRYIHANPLKDGFVHHLEAWPYSNVHEWMGFRGGMLFDAAFVDEFFPDRARYRTWVLEYVDEQCLPDALSEYRKAVESGQRASLADIVRQQAFSG